ncbi:MAG: F0F1 ATP synthase subunit alpha [Oscillospiraceae bacterium]|nr:F0F1 ATP synthase subunit alpha [Oscillospiraceae bacterium]MCR5648168.1 F0F1 ATP synthase subunit alpha [Oscillospiraceae bacterium]
MKGTVHYANMTPAELEDVSARFDELFGERGEYEFVPQPELKGGFIAHIGGRTFDMSVSSRLSAVRGAMTFPDDPYMNAEKFASVLAERTEKFKFDGLVYEYGTVVSSGDGIIHVKGLSGRRYGELLTLADGGVALALEISDDEVGAAVLFGQTCVGERVSGTNRVLDIPAGDALLGRIISPVGDPLDGKSAPVCHARRPIEYPAPGIMDRKAVSRPLQTGLLSIDSMIPIGRGQRELIIGDRQTGKTTIAVDTILNQHDQDVVCVYCAIGQKASAVAEVVRTLQEKDAMRYTIVVNSPASDSAAMQYIAPYAACAIAEYFMYSGRDALVVYDDLSKHAVAYRAMSLLLHRPPGREAYPGDVFYLHSRLLERGAQLCGDLGGGSLTALPIVETMAGDISAYIPTNVISITDGQIFLESELFHSGMRPAVNVGLSVSRVGRSAQRAAMRKVTGTLRLDLAQYREMSVFLQFGAEVDSATAAMLERGVRKSELLKQPKHDPYSLADEVCLLLAAENGIFADVPPEKVSSAARALIKRLRAVCPDVLGAVSARGDIDEEIKARLLDEMRKGMRRYGA